MERKRMWHFLPQDSGMGSHSVLVPASFGKTIEDFESSGAFLKALREHHAQLHAQSR